MKTETEVKFLDVDFDAVRNKLKSTGAVCEQPMRLMRRAIIDYPDTRLQRERDAYIRVRDEGIKITLTYKQFNSLGVSGAQEIETTAGSFDDTIKIFEAIGMRVRSLQESKRETWRLEEIEIVLDEWPWLKPYIEIEGENEEAIKAVAIKLGFDWNDAVFGDVMAAYRAEYSNLSLKHSIGTLPYVGFNEPLPSMLKK